MWVWRVAAQLASRRRASSSAEWAGAGFFRTELLVEGSSTIWPELEIEDYADRTTQTIKAWRGMNGQQGGDPARLAQAIVTLSDSGELPLRFVAGADAMAGVEQNLDTIRGQIDAHRDLSASLSFTGPGDREA